MYDWANVRKTLGLAVDINLLPCKHVGFLRPKSNPDHQGEPSETYLYG